MKILVAMNHKLSWEQVTSLEQKYSNLEIVYLCDIQPAMFECLANCPDEEQQLQVLAHNLSTIALAFDKIILPIGSPAFMYIFARINYIEALFSHSIRCSEEVETANGIEKRSVFKHIKWI